MVHPSSEGFKIHERFSDALMVLLYLSFTIFANDVTGAVVMAALVALIILINILGERRRFGLHFGKFQLYMALFATFSFMSTLWAVKPDYAVEKGGTLFQLAVIFTLLYATYYYARIERLLKIVMWSGFILAIYTIVFYGFDTLQTTLNDAARLENDFANVNSIGMGCSTSIIIAYFFYKRDKSLLPILFSIPAILIVALTGSRKAFVMLIFGILLLLRYQRHSKKASPLKRGFNVLGSVIVFLIIIYFIGKQGIFEGSIERMDGFIASITGKGEVDHSTYLRNLYRALGFAQFIQTPILGMGMGCARTLALRYTGHDCYLHCNYAELAANGGIIGLILYYWIYVFILKKEIKAFKYDSLAPIILIIVSMTLMMDWGAVLYYSKTTYFTLMIVMLHINKLRYRGHNQIIAG